MVCSHCGKGVLMEYPDFYSCLSCRHQTFKEISVYIPNILPAANVGAANGEARKPVSKRTETIVKNNLATISAHLKLGLSFHKITMALIEKNDFEVSFSPQTVKKYYERLMA